MSFASRVGLELPEPSGGGLQLPGASLHLVGRSSQNQESNTRHRADFAQPKLISAQGKERSSIFISTEIKPAYLLSRRNEIFGKWVEIFLYWDSKPEKVGWHAGLTGT
ncbi:hypothetical protein GOODEAATRI_000524 [Goodea atripinnis]|uniref:Uncharacterized protein n=1 Tax=Goodea atripinnis TaxID=208336 RepID=A0ABV0P0C9_9TELE